MSDENNGLTLGSGDAATPVIKTSKKKVTEVSDVDRAAQTYQTLVPIWKRLSESLPKKALIRVVDAIMEWPLEDENPKFQKGKEFEAFKIGTTIIQCKEIMVSHIIQEKLTKRGENSGS